MLRTYIIFDENKIELTEIEFNGLRHEVKGVDAKGNKYVAPAESIIIEEDFNDSNRG